MICSSRHFSKSTPGGGGIHKACNAGAGIEIDFVHLRENLKTTRFRNNSDTLDFELLAISAQIYIKCQAGSETTSQKD